MQDELKTEFKKTLTKEESDRLDALTAQMDKFQKEYSDASIERLDLETQKQNLEQEIRMSLYPRRDQLKSRSVDEDDDRLEERKKELAGLKKALADITSRQRTTEHEVEKIAKSMRENQAKLTELQVPTVGIVLTLEHARRDCTTNRTQPEDGGTKYGETNKSPPPTRRVQPRHSRSRRPPPRSLREIQECRSRKGTPNQLLY